MFLLSVKPDRKKLLWAAAALLLTAVGIFLFFSPGKEDGWAVTVGNRRYTLRAETGEERMAFLRQFGWTVNSEPLEITEVAIPAVFNEVYLTYNELQKSQGLDLSRYAGKICKKWVYEVTNYPGTEENVRATLLILDGRVIGGDLASPALDGFQCGFAGPKETEPSSSARAAGARIASSEIPASAWPTD